jgi:WD40 repeat protein
MVGPNFILDDILTSLKEFKELNYSKMLNKRDDKSVNTAKVNEKSLLADVKVSSETQKSAFDEIIKKHRKIRLVGHTGSIYSISISPDKKYIISGSFDETIRLWNFVTKNTLVIYKGHFAPVLCVKFSPFSHYFASGGSDRTAKLWSVNNPGPLRLFVGHLSDVEVTPDLIFRLLTFIPTLFTS